MGVGIPQWLQESQPWIQERFHCSEEAENLTDLRQNAGFVGKARPRKALKAQLKALVPALLWC